MIDAAVQAVGSIKSENITELRSFKMPPDAIRDVLEGVLLLMGREDTSWNGMKQFLGTLCSSLRGGEAILRYIV